MDAAGNNLGKIKIILLWWLGRITILIKIR